MQSDKKAHTNLIRWIFLLPASFLAYFLTFYITGYLLNLSFWLFEEKTPFNILIAKLVFPVLTFSLACYSFIRTGAYVAPSKGMKTYRTLFFVFVIGILIAMTYTYIRLNQIPSAYQLLSWSSGLIINYFIFKDSLKN